MTDQPSPVEVIASEYFQRALRQLAKKYRHIRSDVQPVIDELQTGKVLGDQIPNMPYETYKVRVANSDAKRGKSGGYRLIYYIQVAATRVLITLYSKSDVSDIPTETLVQWIEEFQQSLADATQSPTEAAPDADNSSEDE